MNEGGRSMEEKPVKINSDENFTEKLYYKDSHQKEFTAEVLSCEKSETGYCIVLNQTAFFPEGGGQLGDIGWINDVEVVDTQEKNGVIYHKTKEPLTVGDIVKGKLDFEKRFSRMQQHSGEHIISGIVHCLYGYENVGFHLGEDVTTLDFNGELSKEQVLDLELRANRAVFENVTIQVLYSTKEKLKDLGYRSKIEIEGSIRIVSIPGYDICACCAPHVNSTGEIGLIKILSCERHRGGCRMTIVCGMRALADYQAKQQSVTAVSVALSAKPDKIEEAVIHLKEQQEKAREQLHLMQAAYLQNKLDEIAPQEKNICIFETDMDNIALRNFVNEAVKRVSGICAAFVGTDEGGYHYILGSSQIDLREFSKELNAKFHGKGGGKKEMVQGSLTGKKEDIMKMIVG